MTVGVIESQMPQPQRRKAYECDITYGTAKEFGFDFLRDSLLVRRIGEGQTDFLGGMLGTTGDAGGDKPVQRPPYFILVDEADSILIDEARTPLIISALPTEAQRIAVESYKWSASVAADFVEDEHYDYDHDKRSVELTTEGRRLVRELQKPTAMHSVGMFTIYEYIERAIKRRTRVHPRPAIRRARWRDRHRRRVHRPHGRRAQMAGRHPSGRRGQTRGRSHRRNRTGRADHHPGLFPALSASGRHDRHGIQFGQRAAQDLQPARGADSHQSAGHSPAIARSRVRHSRSQMGSDCRRSGRTARAPAAPC